MSNDENMKSADDVIEAEVIAPTDDQPMPENEEGEVLVTSPALQKQTRSGFFPLLLGGLLAGGIGFSAHYVLPILQPVDPAPVVDLIPLIEENAAQAAAIEKLSAALAGLPRPVDHGDDFADIRGAISAQAARIATAEDAVKTLRAELQSLAAQPMANALPAEAIAAYESALADLQSQLAAERDKIAQTAAQARADIEAAKQAATASELAASALAQQAAARASLGQIMAALETGNRFSGALAELEQNYDGDIPQALRAVAQSGVPSPADLIKDFAPAAREALKIARADAADSGGGVGAFLKSQLGIRALSPQEGNSPDAIISRADAAVKSNAIQTAFAEIATLPQDAQTAFSTWVNQAKSREDAVQAAQSLRDALRVK